MNKLLLVAKREYITVVRKKSFWLSTLLLPILIVIVSLLNTFSAETAQQKFEEIQKFDKDNVLLVLDETGLIDTEAVQGEGVEFVSTIEEGKEIVLDGGASVFFYYPQSLLEGKGKIEIYRINLNVIENNQYNSTAVALLRSSVLSTLDQTQYLILETPPGVELNVYENGEKVEEKVEDYIVPIGAFVIYFLMITSGTSYLLASVAEEKESRMMEIILTSIRSDDLIKGKLLGLIGIVVTQITLLITLGVMGLKISDASLPIDVSQISIDPVQAILSFLYAFLGFVILANIMVGVGAAMPTLKESQSFSSVFIMLAILPLYMIGFLIADPDGTLALILSYVPISSPLILLFRNGIGVLSSFEIVASIVALILQLIISYFIALKLFELGALEFGQRISFDTLKEWYKSRGS